MDLLSREGNAELTMMLLVKRSAPLSTIITSPMGKRSAPRVRIRPGALVWYHGAVSVLSTTAHLAVLLANAWTIHARVVVRLKGDRS